jgi:hypothetical protein
MNNTIWQDCNKFSLLAFTTGLALWPKEKQKMTTSYLNCSNNVIQWYKKKIYNGVIRKLVPIYLSDPN